MPLAPYNGRSLRIYSPEPDVLVVESDYGGVSIVNKPQNGMPLTLEMVRNALVTLDAAERAKAGEFDPQVAG